MAAHFDYNRHGFESYLGNVRLMAIRMLSAQMLLAEHLYRPITGTIVTLGRNTVAFSGDEMDRLLNSMGVNKRPGVVYEIDKDTMGRDSNRITQESFFASFCDARVISLDVSDYEGAEIVIDIQNKLLYKYRRIADFVYDSGSLDNIFDTASTLKNISRLMKPGGRLLACNNGGPHPTSYLKFSADWFMDFFTLNQYLDCKCYICEYPNTFGKSHISRGKATFKRSPYECIVYSFNPYVTHEHGEGYDCSSIESQCRYDILVFAEKGPNSTDDLNPIQKHYRSEPEENRSCNEHAKRFLNSDRPTFSNPTKFDLAKIPRIDSSDYPEQIKPVAVLSPEYTASIRDTGSTEYTIS